jgi:PIN domain
MHILKSRYVYLDTQVFESLNFQFSEGRLKGLCDYAKKGRVSLYLTEVTLREVKARINKRYKESMISLNEFKKNAKILRNLPEFEGIFSLRKSEFLQSLFDQLNAYITEGKITILPVAISNSVDVFNRYFEDLPPFSEGKKKHEFPDAFSISILENWCKINNCKIYIVSNDNDLISACLEHEFLLSVPTLPEMLEIIQNEESAENKLEQLSQAAHRCIDTSKDYIESIIQRQFEESEFIFQSDSTPPDEDGEVLSVNVSSLEYETQNLVSLEEESAVFQIRILIRYTAEVSYPDPDMTAYDSEDGVYIVLETLEEELEKEQEVDVEIRLYFKKSDEEFVAEIDEVQLLNGPFELALEEHDGWPYK